MIRAARRLPSSYDDSESEGDERFAQDLPVVTVTGCKNKERKFFGQQKLCTAL